MKKYSFLMAIGLIVALFALSMNLKAETVTIVSNSNSGIENATYTATFSDGTVLGFTNQNGYRFCGAITQRTSLTVPDSVIIYSSSSTNRYHVKYIGYNNRLDFDNAQSVTSLILPPVIEYVNSMAPTVKVLHANSYISSVNNDYLLNLEKVLVPESTLSSYLGNSSWYNYVMINAEGTEPLSLTLNMTNPGELAQHILEQAGDWNKVNELTVTGELNSDDLLVLHRLRQLTKLDLSNAVFTALPNYGSSNSGSGVLENVMLPNINTIGSYAFYGCRRLKTITLPESVTSIGSYAFSYSGLTSIDIPNSVTTIGNYAFQECFDLTTATIPPSVTGIGMAAFYDCKRLNNVSFAEGLSSLGSYCFGGCTALTEIDLPSSLRSAVEGTFRGCTSIKKMVCRAVTPPTQYGGGSTQIILDYCDMTNVKLYVPAMSIDAYRSQYGWKSFYTILPLEEKLTDVYIYDNATIDDGTQFADGCNFELNHWYQNRNGSSKYYCGTVDYNGMSTLSMGNYVQIHHLGAANSNNPYSSESHYSALVANGSILANHVETTLYTVSKSIWYFICLPYDVKVSDITYTDGTQFVIRRYSGLNRAQSQSNTWLNLTADSIMHAYEGYILKCNRNDFTVFTFPAVDNSNKNRIFEKDNAVVPLKEYLSEFDHNRSWNLIGNPYPCYYDTRFMDFTAPIIVWNRYNSRYDAYSPIDDSFILTPAQAFFVQCPINKTSIIFDKDGRQKNADVRSVISMGKRIAASRHLYNVVLTSGETEDHTRFVFNDAATRSYELDKDASKLIANGNTSLLVYTVENDVRYAINERDYADGIINLGFYAPEDGEYCLSLESNTSVGATLIDHEKETQTSMMGTYTFMAKAGYNDARFTLVFGQSGIIELNNDEVTIDVHDGVVSSNVRCNVYTIDGRQIGYCDGNNTINLDKGVYVICGNNVTRKIIVK